MASTGVGHQTYKDCNMDCTTMSVRPDVETLVHGRADYSSTGLIHLMKTQLKHD
jgi:hypothetical protein